MRRIFLTFAVIAAVIACQEPKVDQPSAPGTEVTDPTDPGDNPDDPGENPGEGPENPGENPDNPGENPEGPGEDPGDNTGEDPQNPDEPETPADISDVHIPAYAAFLRPAPAAGDTRSMMDAAAADEARTASEERMTLAEGDVDMTVKGLLNSFSSSCSILDKEVNWSGTDVTQNDITLMLGMITASAQKACPGEYPSAIAVSGWAASLLLAQLDYPDQTEILNTGIRIGESAVISGRSSLTAVIEGRIVGCLLMSSLRTSPTFAAALNRAMQKAPKSDGYPALDSDFADSYAWLPAHPEQNLSDAGNYAIRYDRERFYWGRELRESARGEQAVLDDNYSGTYMRRKYYSTILGYEVTWDNSPKTYDLVNELFNDRAIKAAKYGYDRERPFDFFGSDNAVGKPSGEGLSYPSGHTCAGMAVGLLFSEIVPEYADSFYQKGYEYGISRVIVGVHYQSDVDAGYLGAAASLSRYHAVRGFDKTLAAARREYRWASGDRLDDNSNPNIHLTPGSTDEEFK